MKIILILTLILITNLLFANDKIGKITGEPIPRYVSIKGPEANLRIGPNKDYPVLVKYIKKNIPVMVVKEFELFGDHWRKITDCDNNEGWIHRNLLSNKRYGIIINKSSVNVFMRPNKKLIGKIEYGNIVKLKKCEGDWCKIKINKYSGWIEKNDIWGVFGNENFD